MSCGDPIWQCPHCNTMYYTNIQTTCNCVKRDYTDRFAELESKINKLIDAVSYQQKLTDTLHEMIRELTKQKGVL